MNVFPTAALSLACGLLGAAAVHAFAPQPEPLRIASVHIGRLVQARIEALRESGTEPEHAERAAIAWGQKLSAVTQQLASEKNLVILVAPSVISGATDITADVSQRLEAGAQ